MSSTPRITGLRDAMARTGWASRSQAPAPHWRPPRHAMPTHEPLLAPAAGDLRNARRIVPSSNQNVDEQHSDMPRGALNGERRDGAVRCAEVGVRVRHGSVSSWDRRQPHLHARFVSLLSSHRLIGLRRAEEFRPIKNVRDVRRFFGDRVAATAPRRSGGAGGVRRLRSSTAIDACAA